MSGCTPGTLELIDDGTSRRAAYRFDAGAELDAAGARANLDAAAASRSDAAPADGRLDAGRSQSPVPPPRDAGAPPSSPDTGTPPSPAPDAGSNGPRLRDDCAGAASGRHAAVFTASTDSTRGAIEFRVSCGHAACHGEDGESGRAPGLAGRVPSKSNCGLVTLLLDGDGDMPSLSGLTDQQLANIVAYLRVRFP